MKVGDLGLGEQVSIEQRYAYANTLTVFPAGSRFSAQPFAMRAPEVWEGQPCTQPSQVWALAAMLLFWMKPGILGTWGCPLSILCEPWCITKLMWLFPNWNVPPIEDTLRQSVFNMAKGFVKKPLPEQERISSLEDEMRNLNTLPELKDLLRFMLVVNQHERPSAKHVLASREFLALEKALTGMK